MDAAELEWIAWTMPITTSLGAAGIALKDLIHNRHHVDRLRLIDVLWACA